MPRHVNNLGLSAAVVSILLLGAGISGCNRSASTATLLAEAKQYQQKGDNKAALIQLKNAVSNSPEDGEARLLLAELYNDSGDAVSAEKEVRKALSLGINEQRALPGLAKSLRAQGQFQKLLDEIKPDSARTSAPLLAARGEALLALNQPDKAKQTFEQALALQPNNGDALLGMARYWLSQQDVEAGNRYAAEAIAKDPNNPEAWMFSGALQRAQGKPEQALAAYDKALALKPAHRSAHIEKANVDIGLGKFDAAKAELAAAHKVTPGGLGLLYTQALLDFTQGKSAAAQESLQKVLRAAPEHLPTILLSGAVELQLGSIQQAQQHLKKYLEAVPGNLYARKLLAQALLKGAQPADAVAALAPALKTESRDPQLLALAGQSYLQAKDFNKASAYFEQASLLAPDVAMLHTSLGLSKLGQGDSATAVSELERGATLDAKTPDAGIALIRAELGLKHLDKALAAALALEKQQPDNLLLHNLKGGIYMAKGDSANARLSFERAVALQPSYFPAVANLARLDVRDKQPDAAKKRFEALLAKDKKNGAAMSALAELAASQGKVDEASRWLERANSENPEAVAPAMQLAALYLRTHQQQKALTLVRKVQTANPTNPDLLDLLGQTQLANQDQAGALETYSKLVNVLPKSAPAQFRLASAHMLLKNETAAVEDLKKAVALQADYLPAQLALAEVAMRHGRADEAVAIGRQIQKQHGKEQAGYILEADVMQAQHKPAQALPLYEKALTFGKLPKLMIGIHRVMVQAGKQKEADLRIAQWLKDNPADVATTLYVAEGFLAKKQYQAAVAPLLAVLKLAPDHPVALNNLAWTYQQLKDPKALETAEAAYRVAGDNPAVMDTLGAILTERGDTARSIPLLQKAVALAPGNLDLHLHLAAALAKSGDKVNARKELDQVVAKGNNYPNLDAAREMLKRL
jgi:putative PEP-CTERM system TPR-repeat lipoprotein